LIRCIASDAHSLRKRPPSVARGLQRARELLGDVQVYQMIETNPAAILGNKAWELVLPKNRNLFEGVEG